MAFSITIKDDDDLVEITLSARSFYGATKKAYWGWMSTAEPLVAAQVVVLQGSGDFVPGAKVVADFRGGNTAPMYLYMAERDTEPVKTKWYNNDFALGDIGPGQAFQVISIASGWRVYRSAFKTQMSTTTEFRTS